MCVGGVGRCPLLFISIQTYPKIFEHAQHAQNDWDPIGKLQHTHQQQIANTLVCWWCVAWWLAHCCGLVCWCAGGLLPEGHTLCGLVVFVIWRVCVNVCVSLLGDVAPLWFGGVGGLVVCWWCAAWGIAPLWVGGWGVGVVVSMYVCCMGAAPWCFWCVGGLVVW